MPCSTMRALVHHQDAVAGQHRGEPVRDHERGAVAHQFFQRGLHQRLALGIERRGRLIEQQQRRVAQDGAGDRDALALAARQRHAALAELRVEAARQAADEFGGVREIGGALDLGVSWRPGRPKRMFSRAVAANTTESCGTSAMRARSSRGSAVLIGTPSNEIVPAGGIVEAQQQVKQRALAGARGADDRDLLAGACTDSETPSTASSIRPRRIGEADILERDVAARRLPATHAAMPAP